jgi:hypothetical protein
LRIRADARSPEAKSIFEQLAAGYEVIHVSPRGYARLYRRKGLPAEALQSTGYLVFPGFSPDWQAQARRPIPK